MSFFAEGNFYLDGSVAVNSTIGNTNILHSSIRTSSIDMLSSSGNYQNITSVADPNDQYDAANKRYVDFIGVRGSFDLIGTTPTLISGNIKGSYLIMITNLVLNGASATFVATKNESSNEAQVNRTSLCPGYGSFTTLNIIWPIGGGIYLQKSDSYYDGSYYVKII